MMLLDESVMLDDYAEYALIGALAADPHAIAGTIRSLPGADFYHPNRGKVWDAARALLDDAKAVTPPMIVRQLAATGDLDDGSRRVAEHEMIQALSGKDTGRAHLLAEQVAEWARRREIARAVKRAAEHVTDHPGDAAAVTTAVQAELETLGSTTVDNRDRGTLDWSQLLAEFTHHHDPEQEFRGIETPWPELNEMLGDLHAGRMYVIGGSPGDGKALALDTPIPTPSGWTTMGSLQAGDVVFGADGAPTTVTAAFGIQHDRPCYEVEFSDGEIIVADADHLWETETRASRVSRTRAESRPPNTSPFRRDQSHKRIHSGVVTTAHIAATVRTDNADRRLNHSIRTCAPLDLPAAELTVPPYVLGAWLGDGHSAAGRITCADPEIIMEIEAAGQPTVKHTTHLNYGLPGLWVKLRALGIAENKHVPARYLRASESQRRALLAGLLDTDGTCWKNGTIEYVTTSRHLAEGVHDLVVGLGYRSRLATKTVQGRTAESSIAYSLRFSAADKVFRVPRKAARQRVPQGRRTELRYITAVRPAPSVPVRCITVDNADHLYLAGRSMIPTHNSTAALNIAAHAAAGKESVLVFSKEMPTVDVTGRIVARGAEIDLRAINSRRLTARDRDAFQRLCHQTRDYQLRVNADPISMSGIKRIARRTHSKHGLDLLVVDYLQLMTGDERGRSAEEEIARISTELKTLALELGIAVVVPAQLNRNPSARQDQRPSKADLRQSGRIEQDADVVILLWRQPVRLPGSDDLVPDPDYLTFIVDKNRHGPKGLIQLRWNGGYGAIG